MKAQSIKGILNKTLLVLLAVYGGVILYGDLRKERCIKDYDITFLKKIDADTFFAYNEHTKEFAVVDKEFLSVDSYNAEVTVCLETKPIIGSRKVVTTFLKE